METSGVMRVFVVDDNELARHLVKDLVRRQGWEVCAEARDGQEAVEMMQAHRPDLVILDFLMPVKDGLQAAREILTMQPTARIILNTLYLTEQLRASAQEIGVKSVTTKSDLRSLQDALNALLNGPDPAPN